MKNAPQVFELSDAELKSPAWMKLQAHIEARLDVFRRQNDNAPPERTERLRGKIEFAKELLGIAPDKAE